MRAGSTAGKVATTRPDLDTAAESTPAAPHAARSLPVAQGATEVPDRATFERLARRDDVPGQIGAEELKFLILGVGGPRPRPQLYFLNTNTYAYHYAFASEALDIGVPLARFNAITYFRDDRSNIAGTIIAHDRFEPEDGDGARGLYALEFWPTDPVHAAHVAQAYHLVRAAMPFAAAQLAYHPAGDTQETIFELEFGALRQLGVRTVLTTELFANVSYVALNLGEGYGVLGAVDPTQARPPTIRDVALFSALPNDLGHVAGVISATPQTPLSHVNLKAKQNDTPNAYVRGAASDARIAPLLGQVVRYEVTAEDFTLAAATPEQVTAWLERIRPERPQTPPRDLGEARIRGLGQLSHGDVDSVGAKAANVAELRRMLPAGVAPDGFAIPFSFYDRFMLAHGFYDRARAIADDDELRADAVKRDEALAKLRKRMKQADVPAGDADAIAELQRRFAKGTAIRCRSSTNNEDLEGFNGAGLYDSFTHRPDEGDLTQTVKQVWASLWNFRAYDERDFHRIDHLAAAMGVLVHPNFDDELANGVAVTKNPYDANWPGFYVNVQVGESLVTNPDPSATPDELLISAIGEHDEYETQYIRRSTLTSGGQTVMTAEQIRRLTDLLATIQERFRIVYGAEGNPAFAMDVEFKLAPTGALVVKQARPWVD